MSFIQQLIEPKQLISEQKKRFTDGMLKAMIVPLVVEHLLQMVVGLADIRMTYGTYAHVLDEQKKATSETMDSLLKGKRAG